MRQRNLKQLSLYPEDRACNAPTTSRILDIFTDVTRHHLHDKHGTTLKTFQPELTPLQRQVLDLLNIPEHAYTQTPQGGR